MPDSKPKAKENDDGYAEALRRIEGCRKERGTELDLTELGLIQVPPEIGKLNALTELHLSGNQLSSLPESIGNLTALTRLNLGGNQLASLPESITKLTALTRLTLAVNQLASLPESLGNLTALTRLDLYGNQLASLPESIGNLTALTTLGLFNNQLASLPKSIGNLTALTRLTLGDNQLSSLPESIGNLTALPRLTLGDNQLSSLPESIGNLTALTELYLGGNQLASLPESIGNLTALTALSVHSNQLSSLPESLGKLTALTTLHLDNNQLASLPESIGKLTALTTLDLRSNQLSSLPESIGKLTALTALYLHDNPELGIPSEVLGPSFYDVINRRAKPTTPHEILEYYFRVRQSQRHGKTEPLNEAKVLLLGQPESGKSSLIHALTIGYPTPNFAKTDGIARKAWPIPVKDGKVVPESTPGAEQLRLNLWDFGGQEIYKATHTYFLTRRALYVIVTTARKDTSIDTDLEEWLETVRTLGDGAPVWVVINKHDENPTGGPDQEALIRKFHPMLRGFIRTQCQHAKSGPKEGTGAGLGIEELRDTLVAAAWAMPEVRQPMSSESMAIKRRLEAMKEPTLTVERYREICVELGAQGESYQTTLLDLWDKLGTVRYFPNSEEDTPAMRDTAILNPEWVTEAVYKVLEDEKLKKANGLVTETDFDRIMKSLKHPSGSYHLIAGVMRRFSQLYESGDGRMFIPQLLEDKEPKLDWPSDGLRFVYEYPVLPPGLVPSFIARMHRFHSPEICPWRRGCVLVLQGCRVLVIGDKKLKQVEISVVGGQDHQRRDALDQVRFKFEELHFAMKGMDSLKELIPVPGHPDAPKVNYRLLRTLESKNIKTHLFPANAENSDVIEVTIAEALGSVRGTQMKAREDIAAQSFVQNNFYGEKPTVNQGDIKIGDHAKIQQIGDNRDPSITFNENPIGVSSATNPAPTAGSSEPWWKSWTVISLAAGLAAGAVALVMMTWENMTGRIVLGVVAVVFVYMLTLNPKTKVFRLFQWVLTGWMTANAIGVTVGATLKGSEGEAKFQWDGGVGWAFNIAFVFAAAITGFLAYQEWKKNESVT